MKATPLTYYFVGRSEVFVVVAALIITVILLLLSGCASRMASDAQAGATEPKSNFIAPTNFIRHIATTDCIIVTNRLSGEFPTNENLSIKLTRAQIKEVLKAVSLLKDYPGYMASASVWDLQLQFFHGTNFLGEANFEGSAIVIGTEYRDYTGTLDKLYNENYDSLLPSYMREKKQ